MFIVGLIVCGGSAYSRFCYAVLSGSHFAIILINESESEKADCFTLIASWISCDCYCYVALPPDALGWSAVCDVAFFLVVLCSLTFILETATENMTEIVNKHTGILYFFTTSSFTFGI